MKTRFSFCFLLIIVFASLLNVYNAKDKAPECEVCEEVLTKALGGVSEAVKKDLSSIESTLQNFCEQDTLTSTHKKICYYLKPIKREISQPFKNGVPIDRICKRLKKKSAEICSIRPPVKVERGVTDYNKMRVKQLKKILSDRGVMCKNCLEKSEFVKKCKETEHLEL